MRKLYFPQKAAKYCENHQRSLKSLIEILGPRKKYSSRDTIPLKAAAAIVLVACFNISFFLAPKA
jgi:hypothetical protein